MDIRLMIWGCNFHVYNVEVEVGIDVCWLLFSCVYDRDEAVCSYFDHH